MSNTDRLNISLVIGLLIVGVTYESHSCFNAAAGICFMTAIFSFVMSIKEINNANENNLIVRFKVKDEMD